MESKRAFKFIFLGATKFSLELLKYLVENGFTPEAIFYIPEEFRISWSDKPVRNTNYADLASFAKFLGIPAYEVDSVEGKRLKDYSSVISELSLDVILVAGWYYIVPKRIRELARFGAWGTHASLLPKYAGNAPLVWAIINGEKKTGVTLFRLDSGIDDGDIIDQEAFEIAEDDTIADVYDKALEVTKKLVMRAFTNIDKLIFKPQDKSKIEVWPPRKPEDGLIDWNRTAREIHNFIRAQTIPYPCAFSHFDGEVVKFLRSSVTHIPCSGAEPGLIVKLGTEFYVSTIDFYLKVHSVIYEGKVLSFDEFAQNALRINKKPKFGSK